jgi:hypothetical protein
MISSLECNYLPRDNQDKFLLKMFFTFDDFRVFIVKQPIIFSVQMHWHMIMIISMTMGTLRDLFMCLDAISGFSQVSTTRSNLGPTVFCKIVFEE